MENAVNCVDNVFNLRRDEFFEGRAERYWQIFSPDPGNRRVEPVKRLILNCRRYLRAQSTSYDSLMSYDTTMRLFNRINHRFPIERL